MLISSTGEEKKVLASMAGKINVTAASDPEKLQTLLDLTAEAIDLKVASDAPSRNALTKLHAGLVKTISETKSSGIKSQESDKEVSAAVANNENIATAVEGGEDALEPVASSEEETTKMELVEEEEGKDKGSAGGGDSILDDLLDDEEL